MVGMELILYQNKHCPYAERARRALGEKGLLHQRVEVGWHEMDGLKRMTRSDTIPTLVAEGEVVEGAARIGRYVNQLNKRHELFPSEYAPGIDEWEQEADRLLKASDVLAVPLLAEHLKEFREREAFLALKGMSEAWARLTQHKVEHWNEIKALWGKVDAALEGHDHLVGDRLTWADLAMYGAVWWVAQWRGYGVPAPLKNLSGWYGRIRTSGQYREQEIFLGAMRSRRLHEDNVYDESRYSDPASDSRRSDTY